MSWSDQERQHHQLPSWCSLLDSGSCCCCLISESFGVFALRAWLCTKPFHIWWLNIYHYPWNDPGEATIRFGPTSQFMVTETLPWVVPHHTSLLCRLAGLIMNWFNFWSRSTWNLNSNIDHAMFEASGIPECEVNTPQPAASWGRCYKEQFQPQTVLKSWDHLPLPLSISPLKNLFLLFYPLFPLQILHTKVEVGLG